MNDIKIFINKFPNEFNELVDIFKQFKINNNINEVSKDEAINLVENPYLKEFLKTLNESELMELFKLLGIKLRRKINTNIFNNNKKTKISILNSVINKMLVAGLEKENEKQVFGLLATLSNNRLEEIDKIEKFEKTFVDELITSLLKINKKEINNSANKNVNIYDNNEAICKIRNKFSAFNNETGNVANLRRINNDKKENILQN